MPRKLRSDNALIVATLKKSSGAKERNKQMKKLMIAAAIVCAAVVSQASSVSWKSSASLYDSAGVKLVNTTSGIPADGEIVLVFLGNGTADWENNFKAANVVDHATTYKYNTSKPNQYTVSGNFALDNTKQSDGDIFTVAVLKGGELAKLIDYTSKDELKPTYTLSWNGDDKATVASFTYSSSAYQFAAVPEPTSAMLLLLGVAGLALRRKQK